jgi:hypothetical protein
MEERPSGKLVFVENNQCVVRNFSDMIIHSASGERFELKCFAGLVQLTTGTGDIRALHVLLGSKETERLAKGYLKRNQVWQPNWKIATGSLLVGWLLRGLLVVFR